MCIEGYTAHGVLPEVVSTLCTTRQNFNHSLFLDPLFFTRVHQGYIYSSAHFSNVTTVIVRFSLNSLAMFEIPESWTIFTLKKEKKNQNVLV